MNGYSFHRITLGTPRNQAAYIVLNGVLNKIFLHWKPYCVWKHNEFKDRYLVPRKNNDKAL